MNRVFWALLIFGTSCASAGGVADAVPDYMEIHTPYMSSECLESQNQVEMDACAARSLQRATEALDKSLAKLRSNLSESEPELLKALEESQSKWQVSSKSDCRVETYYSIGGTGFESIWNACLESKVKERVSFLSWMLENP